jgi:hypothetical protein
MSGVCNVEDENGSQSWSDAEEILRGLRMTRRFSFTEIRSLSAFMATFR